MRRFAAVASFVLFCISGCGENPRIEKMKLFEARKVIIEQGWLPVETFARYEGDGTLMKLSGASLHILNAGFVELEYCSGVGPGYCTFNYSKKGRCLRLITIGEYEKDEYEPAVHSLDNQCPEVKKLRK